MKLTNIQTLLALATFHLSMAVAGQAAGVPGQGTWESTLLGRDINRNPVAATSAAAVYLYDTALNVTWLRNADFYATPFADWTAADDWSANLVTGAGGTAVSDWRLPGMLVANPGGPIGTLTYDGSSPQGYNVTGSSSEMAHLFYVTLGNLSSRYTNGTTRTVGAGLTNTGSFQNLRSYPYWMGTSRGIVLGGADVYWEFDTRDGLQWYSHENGSFQAMAVRAGDVAPAGVIYNQSPPAGNTAYISSTDVNGGSNLESFVIESFTSPTTQTLREIQWRGTRTIAVPVDFKISISPSLTNPGTVWHTNNAASETPTGTPGVYDYKFTLPAGLVLTGGQGYTLQIIGLVNNYSPYTGAYWAWSAGTGGNNIHLAQVPAVTGDFRIASAAGDVAFTLLNAATVPVAIAVQALPAAGGTVTGGGTFNPGDSVTVTATPAVGRAFINWTENGVVVSASASYTFAADGSKTLSANFTGPNTGPYVVTATAVPNGTGNVGGAGTFGAGEVVSLDASPQDPYPFVSWTENGNVVSTSLTYDFPATANRNLQANFTIAGGSIAVVGTPVPANGGTVAVVGSPGANANTFLGGSSVTLTATPATGYHFVNWKQNADAGGPQRVVGTTSPTFTFLVAYSAFLTANFEANNPVLTLGVTPAASGTVTAAGTYANGSTVTANATPAVGYAFASWKSGATVISTSASYTMTLSNHTALTANFVAINRTITATAAPLTSGSVTGAGVFGNGASVTLTATPASGYIFNNWTLGGAAAGTENPAIFNANANYAFVANFTALPVLSIAPPTGNGFNFSWPDTATGWVLQESPDLSPASWINSTLPITTSGGQNQVAIPAPTGSLFFRLAHP